MHAARPYYQNYEGGAMVQGTTGVSWIQNKNQNLEHRKAAPWRGHPYFGGGNPVQATKDPQS